MLPDYRSPSSSQSNEENKAIRQFLLSQNLLFSDIVSHNTRVISGLQSVLQTYQIDSRTATPTIAENPFVVDPLTQASFPYKIKLKMTQSLPRTICKSKYFRICIELKKDPGVEIMRNDRLELTATLYTADWIPQKITHTMQGKEIFRGETTAIMAYDIVENKHLAHFKLQITEVSSHFVAGRFYLVIEAKQSLALRGVHIKPLVVKNLKVRAKVLRK